MDELIQYVNPMADDNDALKLQMLVRKEIVIYCVL